MKEYSSGCASPAASETTTSSCSGASSSPVSYVGGDGAAAMWDGEGVEDWVYGYVLADDRKRRLESKKAEAKTKLAVFYPRCTVQQELERLRQVREESPAYATQIIAQASNMIEMAEKGYLQGIIQVVLAAREVSLCPMLTFPSFTYDFSGRDSVVGNHQHVQEGLCIRTRHRGCLHVGKRRECRFPRAAKLTPRHLGDVPRTVRS